jgi:Zn-dependent protease
MAPDNRPEEPLEIETFVPGTVELIDPAQRVRSPQSQPPQQRIRSRKRLALGLFVATCLSTFLVGMTPGAGPLVLLYLFNGWLFSMPMGELLVLLQNGLLFSGCVMLILFAHEMGHYLQARRYHVPATLPFFIPFPISPFGTMGAVIIQGAGVANRKQLFDIAISGPLAGLVLALPIAYFGLQQTEVFDIDPSKSMARYGDPLILQWMIEWIHGPLAENQDVQLTPMLFAGWVGIFVTALNLIPIGQLDGGHLLYTLIGKRSHGVAVLLLFAAIFYMLLTKQFAYALMVALLMLMGPRHPPTANDRVPLGRPRVVLGWLTLAFIVIGFTPTPLIQEGTEQRLRERSSPDEILVTDVPPPVMPHVADGPDSRADTD